MKVILAGNPNTGKTTLFNTLTNSFQHASNWHGVTVDVVSKKYIFEKREFEVCDIPGLYSLDGYSKEEKIASDFICKNSDAVVVCVLDANNLKRNLLLALEIKKMTENVIFAVNMANEVRGLDLKKFEEEFGVKVVLIDARKKNSVKKLKIAIAEFELKENVRSYSKKEFSIERFEKECKESFLTIEKKLRKIGYQTKGTYGFSKFDNLVLSRIGSFLIFFAVMGLVFFITFGAIGNYFSSLVNGFFSFCGEKFSLFLKSHISNELVVRFLDEGIVSGVLSVASFLPQIVLLFLCLNFLEDLGYLSRVAFIFDPLFKRLGLSGRSAFSLIMGFGCTTTAILTSRNLDNKKLQKRTTLLLPFMSCSAKLPIFAVIVGTFFLKHKVLIVLSLYFFAIFLMFLVSLVLSKKDKSENEQTFLLEMPKYRFPSLSKIFKNAFSVTKSFVKRVGGAIVLSSMIIFLLYNFNFRFQYVGENMENSILFGVANLFVPLFKPLGFGNVGSVVAIFSGFVAKEMVVSSLAIANKVSIDGLALSLVSSSSPVFFSKASAISFVFFVLLYSPCVSACIMMKKEIGSKSMWLSIVLQFVVAYLSSFVVFNLINSVLTKQFGFFAGLVIIVGLIAVFVIKYLKKKEIKCEECHLKSCEACKKH